MVSVVDRTPLLAREEKRKFAACRSPTNQRFESRSEESRWVPCKRRSSTHHRLFSEATCYLQVSLFDRHRRLTSQKTKRHRLNSTMFNIDEQFDFNILNFSSCNFDRFMIEISFHSNSTQTKEHRCLAHLKVGSIFLCSGSGPTHWQQVRTRNSFSMWHFLNKYQNAERNWTNITQLLHSSDWWIPPVFNRSDDEIFVFLLSPQSDLKE